MLAEKKAEFKWCSVSQDVVHLVRPHSTRIAVQTVALSSSVGTAVSVKLSRLVLFMPHLD